MSTTLTDPFASAHTTLTSAAADLLIRSEVSTTLQSILHDIETAHSLQTSLRHTHQIASLESKLHHLRDELDERRAYERSQISERIQLADKFVGELFVLSLKVNELESWKEDNQSKIVTFDELKRSLDRAEEMVRMLKRTASLNLNANVTSGEGCTPGERSVGVDDIPSTTVDPKEASLEGMSNTLLLDIFAYLDAFDVLKAAQVNVAFYSKVDTLFGIGGDPLGGDDGGMEDIVQQDSNQKEIPSEIDTFATASTAPTEIIDTTPNVPISQELITKATITSPQPQRTTTKTFNQFLSKLSITKQQPEPTTLPSTKMSIFKSGPTTTKSPNTTVQLNATMANSMADKLTPAELAVIINMTESLRLKDSEITRITAEREDLTARLEGAEAVKEFLVTKVRDVENKLNQSTDTISRVSQKTGSDQEVIAFLDARVEELELIGRTAIEGKAEIESSYRKYRNQSEKRLKVIEDMLQFERQQLADQEKEWRVQRKLLAKEVKHCRAQIVALQAERDAYVDQNKKLKQALFMVNGTLGGAKIRC